MTTNIVKHEEHEVRIAEGNYWALFTFRDGEMIGMKSNMSYRKSKEEWKFFSKAIDEMLEKTKDFYIAEKRNDDFPF